MGNAEVNACQPAGRDIFPHIAFLDFVAQLAMIRAMRAAQDLDWS
jgi:hypothetical protein